MIKEEKGIALVSLIITIAVMTVIASTVVYMSLDRFEINNLRKMYNDIELLQDKVSNYYLKYGVLPVLRDNTNTPILYPNTNLNFEKNSADNSVYYILDLEVMEGISLNYGEFGFKNANSSEDVYIINEESHTIYYVMGIEMEGVKYHSTKWASDFDDTISPSKPQINIISGTKNDAGIYTSNVEIEIIPGKDNGSQVEKTTYAINGGTEKNINTLTNNIYPITTKGTYTIVAKTYDINGNSSETTLGLEIDLITLMRPLIRLNRY